MIDIYHIIKSGQEYVEFIYSTTMCHECPVNDNNWPQSKKDQLTKSIFEKEK